MLLMNNRSPIAYLFLSPRPRNSSSAARGPAAAVPNGFFFLAVYRTILEVT